MSEQAYLYSEDTTLLFGQRYLFGRDISRTFAPLENNVPISLPSQSPTIYVFDSLPSRTVAAAGTGAVQTVSTWTANVSSPYVRTYTITAIVDPDPTGATASKQYWEALNFVLKSSGQTQTFIRTFLLERVEGQENVPGTSVEDVKAVYPSITAFLDDSDITKFLTQAVDAMKLYFEDKGMSWRRIYDLQKTKYALAYKTLALGLLTKFREPGDRLHVLSEKYDELYGKELGQITLKYDTTGAGKPDTTKKVSQGFQIAIR